MVQSGAKKCKYMKLPLFYYGQPELRSKCQPVEAITDEIKKLVSDLIDTMKAHRGQGIAAPQVGKSVAIFIVCIPDVNEEGTFFYPEPTVFINPKLCNPTQTLWTEVEGCLSIPKVWAEVTRPEGITVTYQDLNSITHTNTFTGEFGRAIMHENDHLNGVLFIDRLTKNERKRINTQLEKLKKIKR